MDERPEEEITPPAEKKTKIEQEEYDEVVLMPLASLRKKNAQLEKELEHARLRSDNRLHDILYIITNLDAYDVYSNLDRVFPGKGKEMAKKYKDCGEMSTNWPVLNFYFGCDPANKKKFQAFLYEKIEEKYYSKISKPATK